MAIAAGTRLGPYEVVSRLGAGGMGEVWLARDERLGREVAIKVLPSDLSGDASRLKRFEKEARSASALNHPNIVTVYDLGTTDGVSWIAMERVEGKTLRELLSSAPMPVKRQLTLAAQMAEGLSKAHEAGIVHRDLKPENVMVTKDGVVKILDFGLAKLTGPVSGSDEGSHLPTETGTSPGMLVGTAGYMSPEQASGQALDYRSDQFSFGSILYELATGKRAFQKKTGVDTLSAVLNDEPERIEVINPQAPVPLRWLVERCLSKDPEGRFASTKDLARELTTLRDRLSEVTAGGMAPSRGRRRSAIAWGIAAAALLAGAGGLFWIGRTTVTIEPPSFRQLTFRRGVVMNARFAPDGHTVIYSAEWDGNPPQIYTTRLDGPGSLRLNLPSADLFSVSRSGELAIGIGAPATLARVALSGGGPRELSERILSAAWSPDGESLAVARFTPDGARLEYPIGKTLYETKGWIRVVRVSPDGERVAFADHPNIGDERGAVSIVDRSGTKKTLTPMLPALNALAWSPRGDEVWFSSPDGGFEAVGVSGGGRVVMRSAGGGGIEDVSSDGRALLSLYACRGAILGLPAGEARERDLSWFDSSAVRDLTADGRTLLFQETAKQNRGKSPENEVYIRRLDGSDPVRLGSGSPRALSPDAKWALVVVEGPPPRLELQPTGAGEQRTLDRGGIAEYRNASWFPDGKQIYFTAVGSNGRPRGYLQKVEGDAPRPLTDEGVQLGLPVSPDGRFLVARMPDRSWRLLSVADRSLLPLPGVEPRDRPMRFHVDGRSLFVERPRSNATSIQRVDLKTGRTELVFDIAPDPVGLEYLGDVRITPDGSSYVYTCIRCQADLYLVEGLR